MLQRLVERIQKFWRQLFGLVRHLNFRQELHEFFGPDYSQLETYDKQYPAYDLASLHRALESFRDDCCEESRMLGACPAWTMRDLFNRLGVDPYATPHTPAYQRVLVWVSENVRASPVAADNDTLADVDDADARSVQRVLFPQVALDGGGHC